MVAVVLARESVLIALGEELFFRGLVAGALFRRFGFALGNAAQSAFFILPHLVLLRISSALWPVVDVQLVGAWLFGWLRWRSGSIWPGWLLHTSLNTAAAVTVIATD